MRCARMERVHSVTWCAWMVSRGGSGWSWDKGENKRGGDKETYEAGAEGGVRQWKSCKDTVVNTKYLSEVCRTFCTHTPHSFF